MWKAARGEAKQRSDAKPIKKKRFVKEKEKARQEMSDRVAGRRSLRRAKKAADSRAVQTIDKGLRRDELS